MLARQQGKIINIASLLSFQGGIRVPAYAASKGGVAQLTKALSNEWADRNVQVNAIAPGYFRTENTSALQKDEVRTGRSSNGFPLAVGANRRILQGLPCFSPRAKATTSSARCSLLMAAGCHADSEGIA